MEFLPPWSQTSGLVTALCQVVTPCPSGMQITHRVLRWLHCPTPFSSPPSSAQARFWKIDESPCSPRAISLHWEQKLHHLVKIIEVTSPKFSEEGLALYWPEISAWCQNTFTQPCSGLPPSRAPQMHTVRLAGEPGRLGKS